MGLQANLDSFEGQFFSSAALAYVEVVSRLSLKTRAYLVNRLSKGVLDPSDYENARTRRLHSDMLVFTNLAEYLGIMSSQLLSMYVHLKFCDATRTDAWTAFRTFVFSRMVPWIVVQGLVDIMAFFVEQRYDNLPIIRIWRSRHRTHLEAMVFWSWILVAVMG